MLQKFVRALGGDPNKKEVMRLAELAREIDLLEPEFEQLSDQQLRAKTDEFRARLMEEGELDEMPKLKSSVLRDRAS